MTRAILVKTCQKYRFRRDACNATWAGELSRFVPLYYVEAGHDSARLNGNVIEVSGDDSYMGNSMKVRSGLRMLLDIEPCETVFICDDDTFIHPERWLAFQPQSELVGLVDPPKVPWIHGGAGWYMSRRCCELYISEVRKHCSWDDQLAWEICKAHGIEVENHPELFSQWGSRRVTHDNELITCHECTVEELKQIYESAVLDLLSRA